MSTAVQNAENSPSQEKALKIQKVVRDSLGPDIHVPAVGNGMITEFLEILFTHPDLSDQIREILEIP